MDNPKSTNIENSQDLHDDQAMDSILRELGRSSRNPTPFIAAIEKQIKSGLPVEETVATPAETFFGMQPLTAAIDLDADFHEPKIQDDNENLVGIGMSGWLAVAGVAMFAIAAGLFGYLSSFDTPTELKGIASASSTSPQTNSIDETKLAINEGSAGTTPDKNESAPIESAPVESAPVESLNSIVSLEVESESTESLPLKTKRISVNKVELPTDLSSQSYVWNLKVRFDELGKSQTFLNGKPILPQTHLSVADKAIGDLGHQVVRRFQFLSPAFESPLQGAIELIVDDDQPKVFQFESTEQLNEAFLRSTSYLRQKNRSSASNAYTKSGRSNFVDDVSQQTENVLRQLLQPDFDRDAMMFIMLSHQPVGRFKHYRTINVDQLDKFLSSGVLQLPNPGETFVDHSTFGTRKLADLKKQLHDAPPVNLFSNTQNFLKIEKRLLAGNPRGKVLAEINELNTRVKELTAKLNQPPGNHDKTTQAFGDQTSADVREEIRKQVQKLSAQMQDARNRLAQTPRDPTIHNLSLAEKMKIQKVSAEIGKELTKLFKQRKREKDFDKIQMLDEQGQALSTRLLKQKRDIIRSSESYIPTEPLEPMVTLLASRSDLQGLDFVMGDACHLEEHNAETMGDVSQKAGRVLGLFDPFGSRNFKDHGKRRLKAVKRVINQVANDDNPEQGLTTLDQMLQMEKPELRLELVRALRINQSHTAAGLLACYAKYDLAPSVRAAATDALRSFPAESYRANLLDGFTYPWAEVAKHSAEALVRLNDQQSVTHLVSLLKAPDPRAPRELENGGYSQRELVAINHMKNCALCHADSQDTQDLGRGRIPTWESPLPQKYYQEENGAMVRADVTYLRQDFSVVQKVENAAPWPENQRFDYVVRNKPLSKVEFLAEKKIYANQKSEYHIAIDQALRMLTGLNPKDSSHETWQALVLN
jgi:hypothetical protein